MHRPTYKDYALYKAADFFLDPYFQEWVSDPTEKSDVFWLTFIHDYPDKLAAIAEAKEMIANLEYQPHQIDQKRKEEIFHQVNIQTNNLPRSLRKSFLASKSRVLLVAATISIFVVVGALIWQVVPSYEVYQTAFGETETYELYDGSTVTLNANSSIKVLDIGNENRAREVWIEGEAYFHVLPLSVVETNRHPNRKKFLVHTNNFTIEVVGTTFNVFNRDQKSEVLLTSGVVKVENDAKDQFEILQPGDLLTIDKENQRFNLQNQQDKDIAWKENLFEFEQTPLLEVAKQIESYYGLVVIIKNQDLATKRFTAKISRDQLEVLLEALEESFKIKVSRKEGIIEIQPI